LVLLHGSKLNRLMKDNLETRVRACLEHKFNPLNFAYPKLYPYFLKKEYNKLNERIFSKEYINPYDFELAKSQARMSATIWTMRYERWLYKPILG